MAKLKTRMLADEILNIVTRRNDRMALEKAQKERRMKREAKLADKALAKSKKMEEKNVIAQGKLEAQLERLQKAGFCK